MLNSAAIYNEHYDPTIKSENFRLFNQQYVFFLVDSIHFS